MSGEGKRTTTKKILDQSSCLREVWNTLSKEGIDRSITVWVKNSGRGGGILRQVREENLREESPPPSKKWKDSCLAGRTDGRKLLDGKRTSDGRRQVK